MATDLKRKDIGCWVFKGNAETGWDYFGALEAEEDEEIEPGLYKGNWTLGESYRTDLIRPGELMVLWTTGQITPGIYEFGVVTSDVYDGQGWNEPYIIDPEKGNRPQQVVDYTSVHLLDDEGDWHFPRHELKAHPQLKGAEQFRAPQVTNPSYLNRYETQTLADLLVDRLGDSSWLELAGWGRHVKH
jgi:hypothetical protein